MTPEIKKWGQGEIGTESNKTQKGHCTQRAYSKMTVH